MTNETPKKKPFFGPRDIIYALIAISVGLAFAYLPKSKVESNTPRVHWTSDEKNNADHIFRSLEASNNANRVSNSGSPFNRVSQNKIGEILAYRKEALKQASLVEDKVLDKANPELKGYFRGKYQESIIARIRNLETGNNEAEMLGSKLENEWADWFQSNKGSIRIPR